MQESCTKHINIRYHFIRDLISAKELELMFVPGEMNPADMFTKNLAKVKFTKCYDFERVILLFDSRDQKSFKVSSRVGRP